MATSATIYVLIATWSGIATVDPKQTVIAKHDTWQHCIDQAEYLTKNRTKDTNAYSYHCAVEAVNVHERR